MPGDLTGWVSVAEATAEVWFTNDKTHHPCGALAALLDEHPVVVHRRTHPGAELTRRVSDYTSECAFRSGRVYREVFVPLSAHYQLVTITAVNGSVTAGRCWIINRSTRDFTEADLLTVGSLQPVLALLDTIYSSAPMPRNNGTLTAEARTRAHLTVRTVRKHLEHVYEKLECHDRLLAVNKARHNRIAAQADHDR